MQSRQIPIKWLKALYTWNKKLIKYDKIDDKDINMLIIQGSKDSVVDWKYNLSFLKNKIANVKTELIQKARHHLINETEDLRKEAFEHIFNFLENKTLENK